MNSVHVHCTVYTSCEVAVQMIRFIKVNRIYENELNTQKNKIYSECKAGFSSFYATELHFYSRNLFMFD